MRDKWMNDNLVVYIEKNIFDELDNEAVLKYKNSKKNNYNVSFVNLKVLS